MEKTFSPSQEMVDILMKHNFSEETKTQDVKHWERLAEHGIYSSGSIKRHFIKSGLHLIFDYINITYRLQGNGSFEKVERMTYDIFKSLLFYSSLTSSDRQYFKRKEVSPTDIGCYLNSNDTEFMSTNERNKHINMVGSYSMFQIIN